MRKKIIALILFLFPSRLSLPFARLVGGRSRYPLSARGGTRIGFSWIEADEIKLGAGARIGHGNFIRLPKLSMGGGAAIGRSNQIRGRFVLSMDERARINVGNKITSEAAGAREAVLKLGFNVAVTAGHVFDLTHDITLGANTTVAGLGTQIWTHSFYKSRQGTKSWRVDRPVTVGSCVYIGSRSILLGGVNIESCITLGAGTTVSKSLTKPGLYVSQGLRFIPFDPDEKGREIDESLLPRQ